MSAMDGGSVPHHYYLHLREEGLVGISGLEEKV